MKKNFNRNILICVYGSFFICVLCGFIAWAAYRERDFSQKGWMNCDPAKRYLYIEDFEEKYDVVGMQRSDIEDLLGSPTWTETEPDTEEIISYEYRIQDHILAGWKVYQIRFQSGGWRKKCRKMESYIVVKVKLVIDIVHLTRQVRWI